jgi:hypothetical protein
LKRLHHESKPALLVTVLTIGIAAGVTLSQDKGTAHPMKPATIRLPFEGDVPSLGGAAGC